jgi:hypothetical protein
MPRRENGIDEKLYRKLIKVGLIYQRGSDIPALHLVGLTKGLQAKEW